MTHMHFGHAQYLPIALPLFALLAGALALLLILVQIRVLRYMSGLSVRSICPRSLMKMVWGERRRCGTFGAV